MEKSEEIVSYRMDSGIQYLVKAKGMPFGAEPADLATFFAGCDIKGGKNKGIHFLRGPSGKTRGTAYVEFIEREDLEKALQCHRAYLGDRYVDVSECTRDEMERALAEDKVQEAKNDNSTIVKVSGMPYVAMHDEVATFFAGCDIKGGKKKGITFIMNDQGGPKGVCFVEFLTPEDAELAIKKDREYMGNRFCQVNRSNQEVLDKAVKQMEEAKDNIDEPILKLKGLPFKVTKFDIRQFFEGVIISEIELMVNDKGNCRGDAFVEFKDIAETKKAMEFSRQKISHRHVDIYKSSKKEWDELAPLNPPTHKKSKQDLDEPIIRIQGLPFKAAKEDVVEFFAGLDCVAIQVVRDDKGDCRGEAFIEFKDIDATLEALSRHKHSLGARYIEVFPSSRCDWRSKPRPKHIPNNNNNSTVMYDMTEIDPRMVYPTYSSYAATDKSYETGRKRSYDGMQYASESNNYLKDYYYTTDQMYASVAPRAIQGYGANRTEEADRYSKKHSGSSSVHEYLVNMVGLPFTATKEDVVAFFHPQQCVNIQIIKNDEGKAKGIAVVGFYTEEERNEALRKHKQMMGSRYINIYVRDRRRDDVKDSRMGRHGEYSAECYTATSASSGRRAERSSLDTETRSYAEYTQYY